MVDLLDLPGCADEDAADGDLRHMKARFLASEWADQVPVEVETALETVVDGIAVRGRVDAVFARRPRGGHPVVDWKTGAPATGARGAARALQLSAYRLGFARVRGVPLERRARAFYYARTGETVWPDLPGPAEITEFCGAARPA